MSLDTITLNVGSPAADVVFANPKEIPSGKSMNAPSPTNDLVGRPVINIKETTSKQGIVSTLVQIKVPQANADGIYDSHITFNGSLQRKAAADLDEVDRVAEMGADFFANTTARTAIVESTWE